MLFGFALRLHRLGAESLWYDETVSVHLARKPLADMIAHTAGDIHPPGYYLLLHLWQQITSPTLAHGLEFLYAWPSLFAGMVLMALIYAFGRRLFDAPTALIALWLAAINPFQLWYSQEVRMYTVGASLALLCLWAALRFVDRRHPTLWLLAYTVGAAAGMYTLYYFVFWLVGVNVAVLWLLWRRAGRRARIAVWIGAQIGALVLFLPWLPIFVRQVLDPPVPPWRAAWGSSGAFVTSLSETMAALIAGQSPPGHITWPWALLAGITLVFVILTQSRRAAETTQSNPTGGVLVLLVVFLPIAQLYLLTLLITPVYHVRYVFLYAPLFLLIPAAGVRGLWRTHQRSAAALLLLWIGIGLASAANFWFAPPYRADDHRSAVAALAAQWRPGDTILVNAGWIYPILTTYWPIEAVGVDGIVGWEIGRILSIDGYTKNTSVPSNTFDTPTVVRSGSVDGAGNLGWGSPASDFFAISADATTDALAAIAEHSQRIWHYRLYDTVSDPDGVIRHWLADNLTLLSEMEIPGRDFGTVQLFEADGSPTARESLEKEVICFGDLVCLHDYAQDSEIEAGSQYYLTQHWTATETPPDLAVSLRLYDQTGHLAAQSDAPFLPSSSTWQAGDVQTQSLALPIGASTKPGAYSLEMVTYRRNTGEALPLPDGAPAIDGQRLQLGTVTVAPASRVPVLPAAVASFDYIDLLAARFDQTTVHPGETVHATFYWRPRPNDYRDDYTTVLMLRNERGVSVQEWRLPLGGSGYPSGAWPDSLPVRDFYNLTLSDSLAPGRYAISVALHRASDDMVIPARRGWSPQQAPVVAELLIEAR